MQGFVSPAGFNRNSARYLNKSRIMKYLKMHLVGIAIFYYGTFLALADYAKTKDNVMLCTGIVLGVIGSIVVVDYVREVRK
jgi:membrane-bound ClpP family serine protease